MKSELKSETKEIDTRDMFEGCFPDVVAKAEKNASEVVLKFVFRLRERFADLIKDLLVVDLSD